MRIYVGNLSYDVTDEDLKEAFAKFGAVDSAAVIKDKFSGRSKGFGFVEMTSTDEANAAIEGLNGKELLGREIKVNEARPKTEGGGGGGGGRRGGGGGRGGYGGGGGGRGGYGGGGGGRGGYGGGGGRGGRDRGNRYE